jgi:hypothetical protein
LGQKGIRRHWDAPPAITQHSRHRPRASRSLDLVLMVSMIVSMG